MEVVGKNTWDRSKIWVVAQISFVIQHSFCRVLMSFSTKPFCSLSLDKVFLYKWKVLYFHHCPWRSCYWCLKLSLRKSKNTPSIVRVRRASGLEAITLSMNKNKRRDCIVFLFFQCCHNTSKWSRCSCIWSNRYLRPSDQSSPEVHSSSHGILWAHIANYRHMHKSSGCCPINVCAKYLLVIDNAVLYSYHNKFCVSYMSWFFLLLQVLQEVVNVNMKIFMNCKDKLSEMPLKR